MTTTEKHHAALEALVYLRVPLSDARAALAPFGRDGAEVLELRTAHVASVLERVIDGRVSSADAEAWADAVHLRDDIGREPGLADVLNEVLTEIANPELFGPLTELAPELLARLRRP